ncbi:kelch repeat-containing protein [Podospora fimiseda]|uniref:Kelch repeat-containing protein n=1 Tax=Podospora fimiseda TaxID=252190 RepID=A0AAN6YKW3_9PEZI|nr:kelch repeat-containing protein [Podospora fimiseda]
MYDLKAEGLPPTEKFSRRVFHSAVVVGGYVYIDGGEVSWLEGSGFVLIPVNSTISIPLNISWSTSSVQQYFGLILGRTAAGVPVLDNQCAWVDPSGKAFTIWGGIATHQGEPPPSHIWRFSVDGKGGGSWTKQEPKGSTMIELGKNVRSTHAAWTQDKEKGYWIGGYADSSTDTSVSGETTLALPGMVEYNMSTGELRNKSTLPGLGLYGTTINGAAQFVPGFGSKKEGVILLMGGAESPIVLPVGVNSLIGRDFNSVYLYDTLTEKWFNQTTKGERPPARQKFCLVGVKGRNGTYEIFMYGGLSQQNWAASEDVYVLSLPGFVFFKASLPSGTSTPRLDHACGLAGKRQMLSIGGTDASNPGMPNRLFEPDPWKNGLGIFDLTKMRWTDKYDADAEEYESPDVVKQWYDQGGLESVAWSSADVKSLFIDESRLKSSDSDSIPSTAQPTDSPKSSSSQPPVPGRANASSAIIGGTVGGVVFLLLLGGLAWMLMVRKRKVVKAAKDCEEDEKNKVRYSGPQQLECNRYMPPEMDGGFIGVEVPGFRERMELSADRNAELPG